MKRPRRGNLGEWIKGPEKMAGFIKLMRTPEALELITKDQNAFVLMTLIAYRAKRTDDFNIHNLKPGEALIGDYKACGLSMQEYRSATQRLKKYGFATFKPTNKGTIATIINSKVYDINQDTGNNPENSHPTSSQQAANNYQEVKEVKEVKKNKHYSPFKGKKRMQPEPFNQPGYYDE